MLALPFPAVARYRAIAGSFRSSVSSENRASDRNLRSHLRVPGELALRLVRVLHERLACVTEREEVAPATVRARRRLELALGHPVERAEQARARLRRVARAGGDLLAACEVEIGERELLGALAPDLRARQRVDVELERREQVVGRGFAPGLVVDDLPRAGRLP